MKPIFAIKPLAAVMLSLVAGAAYSANVTPSTLAQPPQQKNAYFGDLHLHTALSFDAFTFRTRTLPDDSYRFARGEEVEYFGQKVKRKAPLDFLAVTDHSEFLGVMKQVADTSGPYAATELSKSLNDPDPQKSWAAALGFRQSPENKEFLKEEKQQDNWKVVIDAAERNYQPGKFTTFVGYEWSSHPKSQNLHRNVIFRGPKYASRPFSSIDSEQPEDLWSFLEYNRKNGIEALAISHNANVSNGLMYDYTGSDGKPITREYAETRNRNEPLSEVVQGKGNSDTRAELSPNDEFANFEIWDHLLASNIVGKIDGSYARQAYARGLEIASRTGVNPYKFGLSGGSDFHTGLSSTEENNYLGTIGEYDASPQNVFSNAQASLAGEPLVVFAAGGLTGVWAEQNTRESIYDALKRKEVFATSGNRIKVRLFAGWGLSPDLLKKQNWVDDVYAKAVPMGSDLPPNAGGNAKAKAPAFVVQAIKDPNAGNLDRIQIVKVWYKDGKSYEKVFDVAWSGNRKPNVKTGKLPTVGNTVDLKTATYRNSIGATQLQSVWRDPEFDANSSAVYYARVLEIPTPRWTTYWSVKAKLPLSDRVPPTIQERAWTSPIFYKAS